MCETPRIVEGNPGGNFQESNHHFCMTDVPTVEQDFCMDVPLSATCDAVRELIANKIGSEADNICVDFKRAEMQVHTATMRTLYPNVKSNLG